MMTADLRESGCERGGRAAILVREHFYRDCTLPSVLGIELKIVDEVQAVQEVNCGVVGAARRCRGKKMKSVLGESDATFSRKNANVFSRTGLAAGGALKHCCVRRLHDRDPE